MGDAPQKEEGFWQGDAARQELPPQSVPTAVLSQYAGYELTADASASNRSLTAPDDTDFVTWEASEYIHHEKSLGWFVLLGLIGAAVAGLALIFGFWSFAMLIVALCLVVGVYGKRPPRTLRYQVGPAGIDIETKHYPYETFRAFGIVQDGPLYSVVLLPAKRFAMALTMYFSEQDGEQIFDALAQHLPAQEIKPDPIERIARQLRF